MPDIQIVTSQLTSPLVAVPEAATGLIDGSTSPPPTVSLPARAGYHLQLSSGALADFEFEVKDDGTIDFDTAFDGFVRGRGERRLSVRGLPVELDGTELAHGLRLHLTNAGLPSSRRHDLFLLPCAHYGLDGGLGQLSFGLARDGSVRLAEEFSGFATASGHTLTIRGHPIVVDGQKLSHDLTMSGMSFYGPRGEAILPSFSRLTSHALRVLPGVGYGFHPGHHVVADLRYEVTRDGQVILDPPLSDFATVDGTTLRLRGHEIEIDGTALSHDLTANEMWFSTPQGESTLLFLSRSTTHRLQVLPTGPIAAGTVGYGFQPGPGVTADLRFDVTRDGRVTLADEFSGFATTQGNTLRLTGQQIIIDGTRLSHDLTALGLWFSTPQGESTLLFLSRSTTHRLQVLPSELATSPGGYGFRMGIDADMRYDVKTDGSIDFPDSCNGFLAGRGTDTLVLRGYPLVIDGAHADSDLVGIFNLGLAAQTSRELSAVLLPAKGYLPRTANGVFTTVFNLERDGTISFDPAAAGSYVVKMTSSPNPSKVGEEVTLRASVRPVPPGQGTPEGNLTFREGVTVLGSAALDQHGRATLHTSALRAGDHEIVIDYPGDPHFQSSSAALRHRVDQAG
ncbi:Ig-like domain-containing protein [Saccharothrix deserti]|uniref:Ig-like domain-containing protein n=1 Tax=Saccharothrix deserti TaxID=2593674 RepID=UPI00192E429E|nr:Ig-like domain-containing protein [Saccharothrix deserti]